MELTPDCFHITGGDIRESSRRIFWIFFYIGASDFIAKSQHAHPKFVMTAMTLLGGAVICAAVEMSSR